MNKINRKVEYALMALKHMRARAPGELTSAKEISSLYGCPFDVMSRVMQTLVQKGVLRSEQGAHGGYQITKDLNKLSFYDLTQMILGPVSVAKCIHTDPQFQDEKSCDMRGTCNIVSPVQNLNRKLSEFYRGLSVAELLDPRGANLRAATSEAATVRMTESLGEKV